MSLKVDKETARRLMKAYREVRELEEAQAQAAPEKKYRPKEYAFRCPGCRLRSPGSWVWSPASIAGLPAASATVDVGPPWAVTTGTPPAICTMVPAVPDGTTFPISVS